MSDRIQNIQKGNESARTSRRGFLRDVTLATAGAVLANTVDLNGIQMGIQVLGSGIAVASDLRADRLAAVAAGSCEDPKKPQAPVAPVEVDPCDDTYIARGIWYRVYKNKETGQWINGVPHAQLKIEILEHLGSSVKPDLDRKGSDRFFDKAIGSDRCVTEVHYFTAPGQTNGILYQGQDGQGPDFLELKRIGLTNCDTYRDINVATNREDDNAVVWAVFSRMNKDRTDIFVNTDDKKPESYLARLYWFKLSHLQAGVPLSVAQYGSISEITEERRQQLKIDYSKDVFVPRENPVIRVG